MLAVLPAEGQGRKSEEELKHLRRSGLRPQPGQKLSSSSHRLCPEAGVPQPKFGSACLSSASRPKASRVKRKAETEMPKGLADRRKRQKLPEIRWLSGAQKLFQRLREQISRESSLRMHAEKLHQEERNKREAAEVQMRMLEQELQRLKQRAEEIEEEKERLSARLQDQIRAPAMSGHGATWQYLDNGYWHAFAAEGMDQLHQAYINFLGDPCDATRLVRVHSGGVHRQVDFERMEQSRCDTKRTRRVRCLPGVPAGWETLPEDLFRQSNDVRSMYVDVTLSNPDLCSKVLDILHLTGHAQDNSQKCACMQRARIKSVHRIENWGLWQRYKLRRDALRMEHATHKIAVAPVDLDLDAFDGAAGQVMTKYQDAFDCDEELARDVVRRSSCTARVGAMPTASF